MKSGEYLDQRIDSWERAITRCPEKLRRKVFFSRTKIAETDHLNSSLHDVIGPTPIGMLRQRAGGKQEELVSWEELSRHNTPSDLWIAISGVAYDVTEWKHSHPGGWRLLEASQTIPSAHPSVTRQYMC
jgi:hypothetical protein